MIWAKFLQQFKKLDGSMASKQLVQYFIIRGFYIGIKTRLAWEFDDAMI